MPHFHAATPDPFSHLTPGDNGACRCATHAAPTLKRADACTYSCYMCERGALLRQRTDERGTPLPLAGEEKAIKARKQAASLARGGCGCGSYGPRALKAFGRTA